MHARYWEYHFFSAVILDARGAEITEIWRILQKNVTVGEIGLVLCVIGWWSSLVSIKCFAIL